MVLVHRDFKRVTLGLPSGTTFTPQLAKTCLRMPFVSIVFSKLRIPDTIKNDWLKAKRHLVLAKPAQRSIHDATKHLLKSQQTSFLSRVRDAFSHATGRISWYCYL